MYSSRKMVATSKTYTIYCHRNKLNNKCYIGQTCRKYVKTRWNLGKGYWCSTKFYNAIKKYGWDNFDHLILEDNIKSQEDANQKEIYYINLYDSIENGYNIKIGGLNGSNQTLCKPVVKINFQGDIVNIYNSIIEATESLGEGFQGTPICNCCKRKSFSAYNYFWCYLNDLNFWNLDKHLKSNKLIKIIYVINKKTKDILYKCLSISEVCKKLHLSYNTVKKLLSKNYTRNTYDFFLCYEPTCNYDIVEGKNSYISKKSRLYMLDENKNILNVFNTINQAEKILHFRNISRCIRISNYFTVGGYYWCYEKDYTDFKIEKYKKDSSYCKKIVYQLNKEGDLLNIFNSVVEASIKLNINKSSIASCARNERKSAGGYIFKYEM